MYYLVILTSILSYDIWFYFTHRLLHHPILYSYHKKHHTKFFPTWRDTFHADKLENSIMGLGSFFPALYYNNYYLEMVIASLICLIRGILHHDKRFIFIVGDHHIIHHRVFHYNYGAIWIDAIMGTKRGIEL